MFNRRIPVVVSIAVVALLGYYLWNRNPPKQPDAPKPASSESIKAPTAAQPVLEPTAPPIMAPVASRPPAQPAIASPARQKLTLADITQPPEGTPVKDVLTQLRDAADQGIPQAACRLGVELLRCARIGQELNALGNAQAAAIKAQQGTPEGQRLMREAMAVAQSVSRDQRMCGDIPEDLTREAWRYVYLAAAAGNVAAMSRFVRDPGMDNTGSTEHSEGWAAYERDAIQFLGDAIKGGDIRALYHAWTLAIGGNPPRGTKIFQRQPEYAIAYATALRGLLDSRTEQRIYHGTMESIREVGPERAEAARREGEKLRSEYYANATPIEKGSDDRVTNVADCWK